MLAGASSSDEAYGPGFSPPGLEDTLSHMGSNADRQAVIEAVRQAVLRDVDAKVSEKAEELWARGKQMLGQIQQKHKETTTKLSEEVARCREKHSDLEAENEKLKQVIEGLATRFSLLGEVFSAQGVAGSPDSAAIGEGSNTAPGPTLPQTGAHMDAHDFYAAGPFTPDGLGSQVHAADGEATAAGADYPEGSMKLPDVPQFPFPAQPQSPAAPLSLAEALGTRTPQRTPLSLVNSLTPTPSPEVTSSSTRCTNANGGTFTFTLRKADGADLGLNVSHHENDQVLRVEGVRPDGAVEAWNRQCAGSAAAEKAVVPGDRIISVNSIAYDPPTMLEECKEKQLLKLTIARGEYSLPTMPVKANPPSKSSALRADASVFVPKSTDTSSEKSEQKPVEKMPPMEPAILPKAEGTAERV